MKEKKNAFNEQYKLKQNFYYFLCSKINIYYFIIVLFFQGYNFEDFAIIYMFGSLIIYRFFFNYQKCDNPYKTYYLIVLWIKLIKKIKNRKPK
ncbi:hypothetical protein DNA04_07440 [Campylobacter coli]|nr:hypothetical protein [Campylobacter coli]EAH7486137.1 hypothetical protein [Campylobacter jejuni]EAH6107305.1 hypothetical protein [Campylobacter coli]EAH7272473.1 hypothetical protein [Campylobacter coli]EAH7349752.1 hypothetical protein [Campylobacter coli]